MMYGKRGRSEGEADETGATGANAALRRCIFTSVPSPPPVNLRGSAGEPLLFTTRALAELVQTYTEISAQLIYLLICSFLRFIKI